MMLKGAAQLMLSSGANPDLTGYEFDRGSQPKKITERRSDMTDKTTPERMAIYMEVERERLVQDEKWGGPEHDDKNGVRDWVTFIVAYLGKAVNRDSDWGRKLSFSRVALVKVAALCVAAVEAFDRRIIREGLE